MLRDKLKDGDKCIYCKGKLHKVDSKDMYCICLDCKTPTDRRGYILAPDIEVTDRVIKEYYKRESK